MDWFTKWPKDALVAVAAHFLGAFEMVGEPEIKMQVIEMMGSVHDGVAENCVLYFQRFVIKTNFVVVNFTVLCHSIIPCCLTD